MATITEHERRKRERKRIRANLRRDGLEGTTKEINVHLRQRTKDYLAVHGEQIRMEILASGGKGSAAECRKLVQPEIRKLAAAKVQTKTIQQAYKFTLDPTPAQARQFASHVGGARFVYNWGHARIIDALDAREAEKAAGVEKPTTHMPGHFDLCKMWTAYKKDPANELGWVSENFVGSYQAALRDVYVAWNNFFKSRSGERQGRRMGRPRFKAKHRARPSFQVHGQSLGVVDTCHVKLPKIGKVRTHESTHKLLRRVQDGRARLVRGTVSQDSRGYWHIALTVEVQREIRMAPSARQRAGGVIGVDMGVRDLLTLSNGKTYVNPAHLERDLAKLRVAQQALSRCESDSKGRQHARQRVARIHNRVANLRRDALSKVASDLVHSHSVIAIEGWNIQQAMQHGSKKLPARVRRNRNRALAGAGLGELRWMVTSRSKWYGSTVLVADRHQETGRTCGACGAVKTKPVPPNEDKFTCTSCGHVADRRVNTARVLAKWARERVDAPSGGESRNGRGEGVRPSASRRGRRSS